MATRGEYKVEVFKQIGPVTKKVVTIKVDSLEKAEDAAYYVFQDDEVVKVTINGNTKYRR